MCYGHVTGRCKRQIVAGQLVSVPCRYALAVQCKGSVQYHTAQFCHHGHCCIACRFLSVLLKSPLSFVSQDRDPVLLDLGQYWIPRLASCIEAVTATKALDLTHKHTASPLAVELGRRSSVPFGLGHKLLMQLHSSNAAVAAAALAMVRGSEAAGSSNPGLQLHSITARPLHARSKLWNGKLNLAASTQKITKGYFDAPGKRGLLCNWQAVSRLFLFRPPTSPPARSYQCSMLGLLQSLHVS